MRFGSLFSGIGGLDLGLERAGMTCAWQVEIDDYARRVLAKHWPDVPRWDDVRTFPPRSFEYSYSWRGAPQGPFVPDVKRDTTVEQWGVDLICGGFPCQPVSVAGLGRQQADERWLWPEFLRVIRSLRPRVVLLENVPGLIVRGLNGILCDLAASGFDAEWSTLSACSLGAAHPRNRLFVVAYTAGVMGKEGLRIREHRETRTVQRCNALTTPVLRMESTHRDRGSPNGISKRVDKRFRGVGNAVVPQVAEYIGRRIMECRAAV